MTLLEEGILLAVGGALLVVDDLTFGVIDGMWFGS